MVSFSVKSVFRRPKTAKIFRPAGAVSRGLWGGRWAPAQNRLPWPSPSSPSVPQGESPPQVCTSSEEPCTPIRRPQTPCPDHPGARYISMEVPVKEACHVRPSTVALCRSFAVKCTLAAHRCGRYIDFGTVNKRNNGCECAHF